MVGRLIQTAKSAYQYPLIFKQLWHTPLPDQEVVYRDLKRFTYRQIRERIGRLASALRTAEEARPNKKKIRDITTRAQGEKYGGERLQDYRSGRHQSRILGKSRDCSR